MGNKNPLWDNDLIQFARLLSEINAVLAPEMGALCEAMDLERSDVDELFERAEAVWEKAKREYRRGGLSRQGPTIKTKQDPETSIHKRILASARLGQPVGKTIARNALDYLGLFELSLPGMFEETFLGLVEAPDCADESVRIAITRRQDGYYFIIL